MKCEEVQQLILLEDNCGSDAQKHIDDCKECQEFHKGLGVMMKTDNDFAISQSIDDKILNYAKTNRPVNSKQRPLIPFVIMAAAAVIAILLSVSLLNKNISSTDKVQEAVNNQGVDNPLKNINSKEIVVKSSGEQGPGQIDDMINNLWDDDSIDADLMAVESELFVLSAEMYSN